MFLVRCPRCGKDMKCAPRIAVTKAIKRCVYCGRSFKIHSNQKKTHIIKKMLK